MKAIHSILIGVSLFGLTGCVAHLPKTPPKIDTKTGLMWEGHNDVRLNWFDANVYCQDLDLSEQSDWHLPDIKELQTLVDITKFNPAAKNGFDVIPTRYWSSTPDASISDRAWYVYFESGGTFSIDKEDEYNVRCVRGEH